MADNTWVHLMVPEEYAETVEAILEDKYYTFSEMERQHGFLTLEHDDADPDRVPLKALVDLGIPFDCEWGQEYDRDPGSTHCRFTEHGESVLKTIFEHDENTINLYALEQVIDNLDALQALIRERREELTILPWDNQVEYGKRFLVAQLLKGEPNG